MSSTGQYNGSVLGKSLEFDLHPQAELPGYGLNVRFRTKQTFSLTLRKTERHTRYVMLVRVPSKDTKTVINALIKQAHKLPRELYKSLTWDRGKEMADHERFTLATDGIQFT